MKKDSKIYNPFKFSTQTNFISIVYQQYRHLMPGRIKMFQ